MFKRIIQSVAICLLLTSLLAFADIETTSVTQEIDPVEVVMLEPTVIEEDKDIVSMACEEVVEPIIESELIDELIVEEIIKPVEKVEPEITMSEEDIALIALVTMAEAEGESELGQRLVIDVILNQIDSELYPNTASGVIYAPNAFASMWNGRVDKCYVRDDICQLVREELVSRTNSEVLYFRTKHYHTFGTPLLQEGGHYFSGI